MEIVQGWWMGLNYSKRSIIEIIQLACEVAGLKFDSDVVIQLSQV